MVSKTFIYFTLFIVVFIFILFFTFSSIIPTPNNKSIVKVQSMSDFVTSIIYIFYYGLLGSIGLAIIGIIIYYIYIDPFVSDIFWALIHIFLIVCFSWYFLLHILFYICRNLDKIVTIEFWKGLITSEKCLQSSSFCRWLLQWDLDIKKTFFM